MKKLSSLLKADQRDERDLALEEVCQPCSFIEPQTCEECEALNCIAKSAIVLSAKKVTTADEFREVPQKKAFSSPSLNYL